MNIILGIIGAIVYAAVVIYLYRFTERKIRSWRIAKELMNRKLRNEKNYDILRRVTID